jgi:hypothetical protein
MYLRRELLCNLWWWPLNLLCSWLVCKLVWNPSWFHGLPGYTGLSLLNRLLDGWFSYLISYNWSVLLHVPILKLSPNQMKWASTWHTSPTSTIGVCPKWFPCSWYIRRKPCTYLALRLTLSPNILKLACTWPTSPRSTIGCDQNYFHARGAFGANHAPILHQD